MNLQTKKDACLILCRFFFGVMDIPLAYSTYINKEKPKKKEKKKRIIEKGTDKRNGLLNGASQMLKEQHPSTTLHFI